MHKVLKVSRFESFPNQSMRKNTPCFGNTRNSHGSLNETSQPPRPKAPTQPLRRYLPGTRGWCCRPEVTAAPLALPWHEGTRGR